jgi:hypothetical protein
LEKCHDSLGSCGTRLGIGGDYPLSSIITSEYVKLE